MVCQRVEVYRGFIYRQQFCIISAAAPNMIYLTPFFFRYMQLRHFVRENIPHFESNCERHALFELFSLYQTVRYFSGFQEDSLSANSIKKALERETVVFSDQLWKTALSHIHSCLINSRHRLIQFKVIHRFYSKDKFYPSVSHM